MANILTNVAQACADLTNIKKAITDNGVAVESGTPSSEYAEKVNDVYEAGKQEMLSLHPEKTVSGSFLTIDDVSELPHSVGCKVESVNLWKGKNEYTIVGNGTVQVIYQDYSLKGASCPMSISCEVTGENLEYSANGNLVYFHVMYEDGTAEILTWCSNKITSGNVINQFNANGAKAIRELTIFAHNRFTSGTVTISNIMLNEGTTALPYTPYVDNPESVTVTKCGKNLIDVNSTFPEYANENNGISYTNAQVSALSRKRVKVPSKNTVTVSTEYEITTTNASETFVILLVGYDEAGTAIRYSDRVRVTGYGAGTLNYTFSNISAFAFTYDTAVISASIVLKNIQVELGNKATDFEPYNGQTLTPNADGTVEGMTSTYPQMNIFTDNTDAMLDVAYRISKGKQAEFDEFWEDLQYGGTRTGYFGAFNGFPWNKFYPMYDMSPTSYDAEYMFRTFPLSAARLTKDEAVDLAARLDECGVKLNFSGVVSATGIFYYAGVTHVPELDLTGVPVNHVYYNTFIGAQWLETIDKLIIRSDGTNGFTTVFNGCTSLRNIVIEGVIGKNIDFSPCPLTRESIISIIDALSSSVTGQTVKFKKTAKEAAFTVDEWATLIATKTNWTFSLV